MIRLIIIVILLLVIFSLLGIEIAAIINNETVRNTTARIWAYVSLLWNTYLETPFLKGWDVLLERGIKPSISAIFKLLGSLFQEGMDEMGLEST